MALSKICDKQKHNELYMIACFLNEVTQVLAGASVQLEQVNRAHEFPADEIESMNTSVNAIMAAIPVGYFSRDNRVGGV